MWPQSLRAPLPGDTVEGERRKLLGAGDAALADRAANAGLDEGLLSLHLPNSRLYGKSL